MDYKLYAIRVFTGDWPRARAFYRDTLGLTEKFADDAIGWAEFDVGGPSLAVERMAPDDPEFPELVGRFVGLSLQVSNIEATWRTLEAAGVAFVGPPQQQPWGGVLAHLKDPDGNVLTLLGSAD